MQDTLKTKLVTLQRSNGFAEELFGVLIASFHARNIDLFPLNWDIVGLEDCLD